MSQNAKSASTSNVQPGSSGDKSDILTDDFKATAQKNSVFSFGSQWQERYFDETDIASKVLKRDNDELKRDKDELKRDNDELKRQHNELERNFEELEAQMTKLGDCLEKAQAGRDENESCIGYLAGLLAEVKDLSSRDELSIFLKTRRIHAEEMRLFEEHKRILADERDLSADLMRMYLAERHKVANLTASSAPSRGPNEHEASGNGATEKSSKTNLSVRIKEKNDEGEAESSHSRSDTSDEV